MECLYLSICLDGVREPHKDSLCVGRDPNRTPLEHEFIASLYFKALINFPFCTPLCPLDTSYLIYATDMFRLQEIVHHQRLFRHLFYS
jgi:hypothetical protein